MKTGDKTALELFTGEKPKVGHLRVFGSVAYVHVPKEDRVGNVWAPKALRCVFLGYGDDDDKAKKAWVLYDPYRKKRHVSTHVHFEESQRWADRRGEFTQGHPMTGEVVVDDSESTTGEEPGDRGSDEMGPPPNEDLSETNPQEDPVVRRTGGVWGGNWDYEPAAAERSFQPTVLPNSIIFSD